MCFNCYFVRMKNILLLFLLLTIHNCFAQKTGYVAQKEFPKEVPLLSTDSLFKSITDSSGSVEISSIVYVDTSSRKDDLYRNAKFFFTDYFKSAKDVIQYDDRGEGKVIGKGLFKITENSTFFEGVWDVYFTTEITCKDGKFKYKIYDASIVEDRPNSKYNDGITHLTVKEAFERTHKGMEKKAYTRLLSKMCSEFDTMILEIKKDMGKKVGKDDF